MQAKAGAALDEGDEEVDGKESLDKDATTSQFPWLFKTAHAKIESIPYPQLLLCQLYLLLNWFPRRLLISIIYINFGFNLILIKINFKF